MFPSSTQKTNWEYFGKTLLKYFGKPDQCFQVVFDNMDKYFGNILAK